MCTLTSTYTYMTWVFLLVNHFHGSICFQLNYNMECVICLEPLFSLPVKLWRKPLHLLLRWLSWSFHFNWVDCSLSRVHSWFIHFLILLRAYGRYKGSFFFFWHKGTNDLNWSFDGLNATICFVVSAMMNESQIVQLAKIYIYILHWYWGFIRQAQLSLHFTNISL